MAETYIFGVGQPQPIGPLMSGYGYPQQTQSYGVSTQEYPTDTSGKSGINWAAIGTNILGSIGQGQQQQQQAPEQSPRSWIEVYNQKLAERRRSMAGG